MTQKYIPMVRAAFKQQFELAMIKIGISPELYFEKVGIPIGDDLDPESLLPEKPFWELINLVADKERIIDFGIQVAQLTPWHKVESLAPLVAKSSNLEELLTTFCKIASEQSNTSRFKLDTNNGFSYFVSRTETLYRGDRQMELYRVTSMIQLIQLATGSAWRPDQIELQMGNYKTFPRHTMFTQSQLRFSQPWSKISIPKIALKLPVNIEIRTTLRGSNQYDINTDFVGTLTQLIGIYAANQKCKIEFISRLAGLSIRTLQRRLNEVGLTFNDLLNQVKYDLAKISLSSSTLTIARIAKNLGYSDAAHFIRAFKNWSGKTPGQFRSENTL